MERSPCIIDCSRIIMTMDPGALTFLRAHCQYLLTADGCGFAHGPQGCTSNLLKTDARSARMSQPKIDGFMLRTSVFGCHSRRYKPRIAPGWPRGARRLKDLATVRRTIIDLSSSKLWEQKRTSVTEDRNSVRTRHSNKK
eukprot:3733788-Rhodomonas_salina.2